LKLDVSVKLFFVQVVVLKRDVELGARSSHRVGMNGGTVTSPSLASELYEFI
jgi:hypothetical protein